MKKVIQSIAVLCILIITNSVTAQIWNAPDANGNVSTNTTVAPVVKNVVVGPIPTTTPALQSNLYINSTNPTTLLSIDNNFSAAAPAPTTHYVGINFNMQGINKYSIYTSTMPVCPAGYFHVTPASGPGIHMNGSSISFTDLNGLCSNTQGVPGSKYIFDNLTAMNSLYVGTFSAPSPTLNPKYSLYVGGSMICEEMVVKLKSTWADYVFSPQYKLKPLSEVKAYIVENNHLPDVPAACEVEEQGVATGEMLTIQMKKIEELTLYMIQMQEANEAMQKTNASLLKRIEVLESK